MEKYLIINDGKITNIVVGEVSNGVKITKGLEEAKIGDKIKNGMLIIEKKDLSYIEKRIIEYPKIEEQLDMLYHSMRNGEIPKSKVFFRTIDNIKNKYPKK